MLFNPNLVTACRLRLEKLKEALKPKQRFEANRFAEVLLELTVSWRQRNRIQNEKTIVWTFLNCILAFRYGLETIIVSF